MERFCGSLQAALKSRRFPWASLNRHLLDLSRLSQIKNLYNLSDAELLLREHALPNVLRRGEHRNPDCKSYQYYRHPRLSPV